MNQNLTKHNQEFVVAEMDDKRGYFGIYALPPYPVHQYQNIHSKYIKEITSLRGFPSEESAENFAKEYLMNMGA